MEEYAMTTAVLGKPKTKRKTPRKKLPEEFIYEMAHGKPVYYRDYQKVLKNEGCVEEIMGSSALQAQLVSLIVGILVNSLNLRKYALMSNELGFIYAHKKWKILDIAIFEKKKIKKELLSTKYVKTAPKIVIEVDTKADVKDFGDMFNYVTDKTDTLLDSGVEKVIWILTESRRVLVAEQGKQWIVAKWNDTIMVLDDISINLEQLVARISKEEEE
jgi:hypothetical protein